MLTHDAPKPHATTPPAPPSAPSVQAPGIQELTEGHNKRCRTEAFSSMVTPPGLAENSQRSLAAPVIRNVAALAMAEADQQSNYTTCHHCLEQGRGEVEVELRWEETRQSWHGVCDCGEIFDYTASTFDDE